MGEGSIYNATAFVTMPAWVVAMIGLGFVGLGNFLLGPPLKERKTTRQADAPAFQERWLVTGQSFDHRSTKR